MTTQLSTQTPIEKSQSSRVDWRGYAVAIIGANALIWGLTVAYLNLASRAYTSTWSLILPGSGAASAVAIEGIGTTSSNANSAYVAGAVLDPRANYKAVAESNEVIEAAAKSLSMTAQEFGKPRVKLLDATALLEFSSTGSSPEEAQQKSRALYQALDDRVYQLRADEVRQREEAAQQTISFAREKLVSEQKQLSAYQLSSGMVSVEQVTNLLGTIEALRTQQAVAVSNTRAAENRLIQLSRDLGLSAKEASDSFRLQSDQIYQQNLKNYSDSSTQLITLLAKWGPNYPGVLRARDQQRATREALTKRARDLLGRPVNETALQRLSPSSNADMDTQGRETLYTNLVTVHAEYRGLSGQAESLSRELNQLQRKLSELAQKQPGLEDLQRRLKISEAVFTSTLAKLDLAKSDIFASYPIVQALGEPSLPDKPSSPKTTFALLGSTAASILVTAGLVLLWIRGRKEFIATAYLEELRSPEIEAAKDKFLKNGSTPNVLETMEAQEKTSQS